MGFWDKAFDVAKNVGAAAMNELEQSANETREIRHDYDQKSDSELFSIVHNDGFLGKSSKERAIAFSLLKQRGFSVEDINSRKS